MKASELRLGNWVSITGNHICLDVPIKLAFIFEEDGLDTRCEGIPLTEEWLLKFGFVASPFLNENILYSSGVLHLLRSDTPNSYGCSFDPENNNSWFREIQYAHQLQNLYFALTGEELEIKVN